MPANPFSPGLFYSDQSLYGREEQFSTVSRVIDQIEGGYSYPPVYFIGPSGLGKTSMLKWVANDLKRRHWLCGYSEAGSDIGSAIYDILTDLQQVTPSQGAVRRILSRITKVSATAGPMSLGLDVASVENGSAYTRLVERFQAISDAAKFNQVGAALLLDEAQGLPADHFEILLRALKAIEDSPIALFVAALPGLDRGMGLRARSAEHRVISILKPLSNANAKSALVEPAKLAGGEFSGKALSKLISMSCGHPLVLKMLGQEAWSLSTTGIPEDQEVKILSRHADRAIVLVLEQLRLAYYEPIWNSASVEERSVLKMVAQADNGGAGRPFYAPDEWDEGMYYGDIMFRFKCKGILDWKRRDGSGVEFTLPGFREFISSS
jgi:AAA ATPase domain